MAGPVLSDTPPLRLLAIVQLLVTFSLALVLSWLRDDYRASFGAALFGGALATGVSCWFYWRTRRASADQPAGDLLADMYRAEIGKFLLAAVMLGLAFRFGTGLDDAALLLGFCVTWIAGTAATAIIVSSPIEVSSEDKQND